jgi:hypothetical protein
MSDSAEDFRDRLCQDVAYIYEEGLDPEIEPKAIPVLAELAEALSSDSNNGEIGFYGNAVENAFHHAIAELTPTTTLFRAGEHQRQEGLTELFGIGEKRITRLGARQSRAAPSLGYTTDSGGEVLRKAGRTVEGAKYKLSDLIIDEVVGQLINRADRNGFSYTGRFRGHDQNQMPTLTPLEIASRKDNLLTGQRAVQSARLSMTILQELVNLGNEGFDAAVEKRTLQTLGELAERALDARRSNPREFPSDAFKELLTWAIERIGILKGEKHGLKLFFGLGEAQGWTADMRYRKASNFLDFDPEHSPDPIFATPPLLSVLRETRDQLVMLAAEINFTITDYWEVDSDIIRMDTDLVTHWQSYAPKGSPRPRGGV